MKYSTKASRTYKSNFNIDEAKLRRLVEIVNNHYDKPEKEKLNLNFTVLREDEVQFEVTSIDDLIKEGNSKGRELIKLTITMSSSEDNWDKTFEAIFDTGREYSWRESEIKINVNDKERNSTLVLIDEIESQINRIKIDNNNKILMFFLRLVDTILPIAILLLLFSGMNKISILFNMAVAELRVYQLVAIIMLSAIAVFFSILALLTSDFLLVSKSYKWLTGISTFNWGDKMYSLNKRTKLINNIIWVIIIGLIVSILAGLIANFIGK